MAVDKGTGAQNPEKNLAASGKINKILLADGKEYELAPVDLNIMADLEEKYDKDFDWMIRSGRSKYIRHLYFLLLKEKNPELTEEATGKLITAEVMLRLYETIKEAIS